MGVVALTFSKFDLSSGNYTILYRSRNFDIEFGQNRSKCSNFSDFEFLENFLKIVLLRQISIYRPEILSVDTTNTECCVVLNFARIDRDL